MVLLLAAVCCAAPLTGALGALAALKSQDAGGTAGTVADIPARMLTAYQSAAVHVTRYVPGCRGLRWPILAGIAKVESNHATGHTISANGDIRPKIYGVLLDGSGSGGNTTPVADTDHGRWDGTATGERAVGPFQFLPATWQAVGKDGNGDHVADPHNADDAAVGAAVHLCGRGRNLARSSQLDAAILQYNHSTAYLHDVLGWIEQYTAAAKDPDLTGVTGTVRTVLQAALSQRGVPYSWGGGTAHGPSTGVCCTPSGISGTTITGFDCSGLTLYAYAQAGIRLPHNAAAQAAYGRRIPASLGTAALKPGDLVFYAYAPGRDPTIHHVGIYLGNGQMIDAPRPGTVVRLDAVAAMSGYAGAARLL
ncbi:glycoside hydrolase [Streptomyces mangrovisoli]|uniref:Glycoside hydrolase n=2 Tax=Streptomyces mangrovisoli TaxID=1428628 RepID=A0A1J4NRF9_9ACTN|nr:glycoside hydrolase [Streptomyces mangrovisoli]